MINKTYFKGIDAVKLENDFLKVLVLPKIGGKIASIYRKDKDFELLFQNKSDEYKKAKLGDNFADFDASGFDDAFPTIDKCTVSYEGKDIIYPDHGEIWSSSFDYEILDDKVKLWFDSSILPYHYEKTIHIENETLKVHYKIKNTGSKEFPCIWTMHCLVNCEEDMTLNFPEGTNKVINAQKSNNLGNAGVIHPYPITKAVNGNVYRLDRILPQESKNTEKYYADGKVNSGICSIYYPSHDVAYEVKFDKEKLPYLGFWVTEGGFRGDYNCAFEPTNGFFDNIDIAKRNNKLFYLNGGDMLEFNIEIALK